MSIHADDLRDIANNHGWPVCELAADEIEELERANEALTAENEKLNLALTAPVATEQAQAVALPPGWTLKVVDGSYILQKPRECGGVFSLEDSSARVSTTAAFLRDLIAASPEAAPAAMDPKKLGEDVARWTGGEYTAFRTDTGEPERWVHISVERLGHAVGAVVGALLAASPEAAPAAMEGNSALMRFYGVDSPDALIAAQARHIEKLQSKLQPAPSFAPQRVREG